MIGLLLILAALRTQNISLPKPVRFVSSRTNPGDRTGQLLLTRHPHGQFFRSVHVNNSDLKFRIVLVRHTLPLRC